MKPVFICGLPRSGTTIVQAVLDSSPKISITNEQSYVHFIHDAFRTVFPRIDAEPASFPRHHYELLLQGMEKHWPQVLYDFHKLRKPEAEICGDKLPAMIKYMDWIRPMFPNSKFILCWRDNKKDWMNSMKQHITAFKDTKDKDLLNIYNDYEMLFRKEKESQDTYVVSLEELQSGTHNEIFNGMAAFLNVDTTFELDLVTPK